jgi:hypothetical protein
MVPGADVTRAAQVIGGYALLFGLVLTSAAIWFRGAHRSLVAMPARRRAA